ncbi:MAG: hypothetical protein LBB78_00455 [Spirochaetaceae bacterium]|jgi:hypothetical protein|nr:hypothetical protein [Spirochaetaceae bacterium]
MVLPPDHHYVRYCGPSQCQEGKILSQAFRLRDRDIATGLSGDHFEHFDHIEGGNYRLLMAVLAGRNLRVKPDGCFAKLRCGTVTEALCHVSFDKPDGCSSHTFLKGIQEGGDLVPELLTLLVSEIKPVSGV